MAATFRTPTRRPGDTSNVASPASLIPRAQHGGAGTPTGPSTASEIGSSVSGTTDSRKRQSKKDEVSFPGDKSLLTLQGNPSEIRVRVGKEGICSG
jgi:hypothetical protein